MAEQVRFGLLVPSQRAGHGSPELRRFAAEAEELGFHSLWVTDRVLGGDVLEPLTFLAWAAALTSRIRLGTSVVLFALRNPLLVAKAAASLDYLSQGRLTFGVSIGGSEAEYRSLGVPLKERVARLRENLVVLRRLWSEERVTHQGRYYQLEGASVSPRPLQRPSIPIWMGGGHDGALRRAAELADGWVAGGRTSVEEFTAGVALVQRLARERGRDPRALEFGKLFYLSLGRDAAQGRRMAQEVFDARYGPGYSDRFVATGSPEDCAARLGPFTQVSAATVTMILGPPTVDSDELRRVAQVVALARKG